MNRSLHLHRLQSLADATATATATATASMSSRPHYRGGWSLPRRSFSGGGDSHSRPITEPNLGLRDGESESSGDNSGFHGSSPTVPPHFDRNRQLPLRHPPPQRRPYFHQNQQFRPPPQFGYVNQQFRPPPQFRPRPPDYRTWEFAKTAASSSKRFTVLSYNILADYLALDHRAALYYHIPLWMLEWKWRQRSLLLELGLWSTDIMCLQEVDRFQDLVEELNRRGYSGIWKMRTGKAVDGCAIFWLASRFKLLHEESIMFNEFGLRDNVAQICVLELMSQNCGENAASPLTGSTDSNKVVICNIHVLYNPKRGDIKLAQIRRLLHRAHAVSKNWDDAPVVLCGDFNCVPKSPLYNYISEQKLDLYGIGRDKVSGQASAEIRTQRTYNTSPRSYKTVVLGPPVVQPMEDSIKPNASSLEAESYNSESNLENIPSVNFSEPESTNALNAYDISSNEVKHEENKAELDEAKEETQQSFVDNPSDTSRSACDVPGAGFTENINAPLVKGGSSASHFSDEVPSFSPSVASHPEEVHTDATEMSHSEKKDNTYLGSFRGDSDISNYLDEGTSDLDNVSPSLPGVSHFTKNDDSGNQTSQKILTDDQGGFSSHQSQRNLSSAATSIEVQEKLDSPPFINLDELKLEGGNIAEDSGTFISALHNSEDSFPSESDPSNGLTSASHYSSQSSPNDGVEDDLSQDLDREPLDVEQNFYDPSSWAPWQIETATGNANCTSLEHPINLTSTYTEAEDTLGIRDSNGEPLVTSYHKRFMGTVDYIWRSEGLQTVRVLAPISKQVMQASSGFPTRKWGSDHMALATELAFIERANHTSDVQ